MYNNFTIRPCHYWVPSATLSCAKLLTSTFPWRDWQCRTRPAEMVSAFPLTSQQSWPVGKRFLTPPQLLHWSMCFSSSLRQGLSLIASEKWDSSCFSLLSGILSSLFLSSSSSCHGLPSLFRCFLLLHSVLCGSGWLHMVPAAPTTWDKLTPGCHPRPKIFVLNSSEYQYPGVFPFLSHPSLFGLMILIPSLCISGESWWNYAFVSLKWNTSSLVSAWMRRITITPRNQLMRYVHRRMSLTSFLQEQHSSII